MDTTQLLFAAALLAGLLLGAAVTVVLTGTRRPGGTPPGRPESPERTARPDHRGECRDGDADAEVGVDAEVEADPLPDHAGDAAPDDRPIRTDHLAADHPAPGVRDRTAPNGHRPPVPDDHHVHVFPGTPGRKGATVISAISDVPARSVLAALRAGVVLLGASDELEYANEAAVRLGVIGDGHLDSSVLRGLVSHVRRSRKARDAELELPRSGGGEPVAVRLRVSILDDDRIVVEAEDVTELHRVERVRRDFVANVSHELKTPVGAMQLLAEALSDAVDDPEAAARFTARIQHESGRMARLVSELLELSRVQGAESMPPPVEVDVDHVVLDAIDRARTGAAAKNITLTVAGTRGLVTYGSESQLATALGNLIDNAINYSPVDTTVTIATTAPEDRPDDRGELGIAVTDQGIGIAEADLDRIFERFYRADPARSRATGGTGLGLAIVKHIAGNHGGRVDVSSTPESGSTFTLLLPSRTTRSVRRAPAEGEL